VENWEDNTQQDQPDGYFLLGTLGTQSFVELVQLLLPYEIRRRAAHLATDPKLVWNAHFLAEIGEAGILPEHGEERMGLYRERPDVSLGCFVESLEGVVYLAERCMNENLRIRQGSLSLKTF
jgi:hypothetical protein